MDEEAEYLYVVFSATPYRMGKLIRFVTREPYNHVAISTEASLPRMSSLISVKLPKPAVWEKWV